MRCAKFSVAVLQASMLDWIRGCSQSAMGICALCHIGNVFGVMVLQRSMLNWRRGSICHKYMCIVLYICRSVIRCAKFGVVVFKASLLN